MKNGRLLALLLPLIGAAGVAGVYKWVDESGKVHFGDAPPEGGAVQSVDIPEAPSQEKIEKARRQMRERMDRYEKFSEEMRPPAPVERPPQEDERRASLPDNAECFSPLSDLVQGPSGDTFTPITSRPLTREQQELLLGLFADAAGHWQGTISSLTCTGSSEAPERRIAIHQAETTVGWDARQSRLTIDTDSVEEENRATRQLFHRLEVGDILFFSDAERADIINIEGNEVELLVLDRSSLSFLLKRRIRTGGQTRIPRAEIRNLTIVDRTFKMTEFYYNNGVLTGFDTWNLDR
jgi:hypothetical protein